MTTAWTTVGNWAKGPSAPNGSVAGTMERTVTEYEIYEADYYGRGKKSYMRIKPSLHYTHNGEICISRLGGGDDGNLDRIDAAMKRAGVTV